jgi:serine O-acetyltransferase
MKERDHTHQLVDYISRQLNHFFPDDHDAKPAIGKYIDDALDRMSFSLKHVKLPGYTKFNYLHSDLYAQFLYFLSNTIWTKDQDKNTASRLFYLNKALHGLNCMYDTALPEIFILIHCVGTVLGKASYSNFFVTCHNTTVGTDKGNAPSMSEGVYLGPGSSIIGNCTIGKFTHLTINSVVLNQNTSGNCIVIGNSPDIIEKDLKRNLITEQYFSI